MIKRIVLRYWPTLIIIFTIILFSRPYLQKGLIPIPADYLVTAFVPWQYYYAMPVKNNAMPDVISQMFPFKHLVIESWKQGAVPLWNPNNFSGNPLLANYQSAAFHPMNWLFFILNEVDAWSLMILFQPLLAGLFMYLFCRQLKLNKIGALLASISFMFCGFEVTWMSYGTLSYALLWLPLCLYAIEKCFNRLLLFLPLISIALAVSFLSGHFQTSLYVLMTSIAYLIFKTYVTKKYDNSFLVIIFIILGIGLVSLQIFPTFELHQLSVRSQSFVAIEVIPWKYLVTLLAPDFYGSQITRNNWFGNYAEWLGFFGVIPLSLAIYQLLQKQNIRSIFFIVVGLFALLTTLPTPLVDLLVSLKIPVLSTSAVSRAISIFSFCFAILAGIGLDQLLNDFEQKKSKLIKLLPLVIISLSIWVVLLIVKPFNTDQLSIAKRNFLLPTLMIFVLPVLVALDILIVNKNRQILWWSKRIIIISVLFLSIFDLFRFANKWIPFTPRQYVYPDLQITDYLVKTVPPDRMFGYFGMEMQNYFNIPGLNGYDPLYIKRYGQLLTTVDDGKIKEPSTRGVELARNSQHTYQLVNLLGGKYFFNAIRDERNPWNFPYWDYSDNFHKLFSDQTCEVYENQQALPRVFIVSDYKVINDPQVIIDEILSGKNDLKNLAIIEETPSLPSKQIFNNISTVTFIDYQPNKVAIKYNSEIPGMLILTDNFYPGWKAYIDQSPVKIFRADFIFRGIEVPSGEHLVSFSYEPDSFRWGLYVTIFSIIMLVSTSTWVIFKVKK